MKTDDAFICSQVEGALKDTGLSPNSDIKVETRNGEVILSGIVDVLAEKWAAAEVAARIPGVVEIDNSITVAIDRQLDDNEISELIQEKLCADPRMDLHQLTATVKDGVVYLEGNVGTLAEEQLAKDISAKTRGVKEVISYLSAGHGDFDLDDATVVNAVETALAGSAEVSVRDIKSSCRNGVVILTGTVDNIEQVETAQRIAAQVPGVRKIKNHLESLHGSGNRDFVLTNEIRDAMGDNGLGGVKCFVVDGTVFLDGAVGIPEQKEMAEEIAGGFEGIIAISNDIQIS